MSEKIKNFCVSEKSDVVALVLWLLFYTPFAIAGVMELTSWYSQYANTVNSLSYFVAFFFPLYFLFLLCGYWLGYRDIRHVLITAIFGILSVAVFISVFQVINHP